MTLARIKNVIFALAAMICLILSAPARTPARAQGFADVQTAQATTGVQAAQAVQATAENEEIPHVSAVDYLDYQLESPRAVFASDGVIVVSCAPGNGGNKIVFFYDNRIVELPCKGEFDQEISPPEEFFCHGNRIYYLSSNILRYVEIGVFEQQTVLPAVGGQYVSCSGDRVVVITQSGINYYTFEGDALVTSQGPTYEELLGDDLLIENITGGRVYMTGDGDYLFTSNSLIYRDGVYLNAGIAKYITDINGTLYFIYPTFSVVYAVEKGANETKEIYNFKKSESGGMTAQGITAYGDKLMVIANDKLMLLDPASGKDPELFRFSIEINMPTDVAFTANPAAKHVPAGVNIHKGIAKEGTFTFEATEQTEEEKDYIAISKVCGTSDDSLYWLVVGRSEKATIFDYNPVFALVADSVMTDVIPAEPPFASGYVIAKNCKGYKLPIACTVFETDASASLDKGTEVNITKKYCLNDVDYLLVDYGDGKACFVAAGEITQKLEPVTDASPAGNHTEVDGRNDSVTATVIVIVALSVFILALFLILVKKEYIKL